MNPTYIIGLGGAGTKIGHELKKICADSDICNFTFRFIDKEQEQFQARKRGLGLE